MPKVGNEDWGFEYLMDIVEPQQCNEQTMGFYGMLTADHRVQRMKHPNALTCVPNDLFCSDFIVQLLDLLFEEPIGVPGEFNCLSDRITAS